MTEQQLDDLEPALNDYLASFRPCCSYTPTFSHFRTYLHGLLSDLPRKTVEPIALLAGTPVRTLQEFLKDHSWDHTLARHQLHHHIHHVLASLPDDPLGTIGLIDETSCLKKGDQTPGVQRQYLGCVGKVDNGIVTVHLAICKGTFQTLLDADLFLPEAWSDDRPRCTKAGIPDEKVHQPKWQLALEQIDRASTAGIGLDWLTFDEEYGKSPGFVSGLDERKLHFVGEVPRTFSCLVAGRLSRQPKAKTKGQPAQEVVRRMKAFVSQKWQVLRLPRRTMQDQVWRVKAAEVWRSSAAGWSAKKYSLIWASNDETGEEKYFLSNAPVGTKVKKMMGVAFRRAAVEHCFRVCKGEMGMMHFEGRTYRGLMRHLSLSVIAMGFAAIHTERLRGEKSTVDGGASVPNGEGGVSGGIAGKVDGVGGGGVEGGNRIPPTTQSGGNRVQEKASGGGQSPEETTPATTQAKRTWFSFCPLKVAL